MKLLRIDIENFRQFYGKQSIEFSNSEKNITIIFGENGKGKTGIFRALMFGLYGNIYLPQDNKKDKIHLINFHALEENSTATAIVRVEFENNAKRYIIERALQGCKFNSEVIEEEREIKLYYTNKKGDMCSDPIVNRNDIEREIDLILAEEVKDFFLFDAEKIDTLAKTDSTIKKEVKAAIVKLLQIDKLERAIDVTTDLLNKENRRITKNSSNIDIINKEKEKDDKEEEIELIEEKIELKKENILSCNIDIENIKEKLEENEEIRAVHAEINKIENEKRLINDNLKTAKKGIKNSFFNDAHKLLMQDCYKDTKVYLNQILIDQKDLISIEIIEKSLDTMVCACCNTNLNEVKEALQSVLRLKNNYKRSELTPLITKINSSIHDFEIAREDKIQGIKNSLENIRNLKDKIDYLDKKIYTLKQKSKEFSQSEENLKGLENKLEDKQRTLESLKIEVNRLEGQVEEKQRDFRVLERQYDELIRKNAETEFDRKRLDYITTLNNNLKNIFKEYSDDIRLKLKEEATNIFRKLIDSKDKDLINKISINDKYEIEIYSWNGTKITQDISQGQRQVVALSFITALAKVAAGSSENIDFPLFMDTPFGRISGNNRDNLIDNIPNLTSQWILLFTDTEFSIHEEMRFKSNNRLGKWYKLEQIKLGHSEIKKIDLEQQMATRR